MNNIIIMSRTGFEFDLFDIDGLNSAHGISQNFVSLNEDLSKMQDILKFDGKTTYVAYLHTSYHVKQLGSIILAANQKNIRVHIAVSHPCVDCSITHDDWSPRSTTLDYYIELNKLISELNKKFNSKVAIVKFEDMKVNNTVDFNKYLQQDEVDRFDVNRYIQLVDLCRYLPDDENPMKIFGYNEIPVSKILTADTSNTLNQQIPNRIDLNTGEYI